MLALAILRDEDRDAYLAYRETSNIRHPSSQACLTYLVLQARADPNITPPRQQPTSMIGLASALGNQEVVDILIRAQADVHPQSDDVPPFIRAVLEAFGGVVRSLLQAKANIWHRVPLGALANLPWYHTGMFAWREPVCSLQIAAAQGRMAVCALHQAEV